MTAPEAGPPVPFQPYGLVSLWDMLEIDAQAFVVAVESLNAIDAHLAHLDLSDDKIINDEDTIATIASLLLDLNKATDAIYAPVTEQALARLMELLVNKKCKETELSGKLSDIRQRLRDELNGTTFFVLEEVYADLYNGTIDYFGFDIGVTFSSQAEADIEEAGKCLALGRGTSCVFHLMRAMEAAVKVLGSKLGVTNTEKEWGKILSDLGRKIEDMPKGPSRDEWSACHVNLYHVKQAWRNSTMHPKETYTAEQAREVLLSVRIFMRQLATLV
ncbi:hypothetical protein Rvan_1231 [Rhodomicrobium vannielii ATCC 17100]|uniref:DUF4145 domain-containing protein n=1 Tax=Rhodomicrobium vannielii (strain ATCC 17100 / DSM 162 / LMG 4299 / NCIMB 10020 / ATH 3.1.1) TaxID=648757 RepID=E3I549_RHOVT|nr:HEPN domain-containing protein [Rhodomicrobium vannielii]ADP70499.1 hypothetical protein Rvan_1231 [Rhodomicrobium vannielii ATCC 17100]